MLDIVWKSLMRRRLQSLSIATAVAVSVALFFALYCLYAGVSLGLDASARRLGADLLVIPGNAPIEAETLLFTGAPVNIYMAKELEAKIASVPGVRRTSGQFFAQTLNEACCSLIGATRLIGFDPATDWSVEAWGTELGSRRLGPRDIVVGAGVEGIARNKAYVLGQELEVVLRLPATGTSLDYSVLMTIDAVRVLAKTIPYLQVFIGKGKNPEDLVSAVLVELAEGSNKDTVAAAVERVGDIRVVKSVDVLGNIKQQMKVLFVVVLAGALLAGFACVAQLFARFFSLAWDRKGEWGLYRALGATRGDLRRLILGEAALLSASGVVAGLMLGSLLGWLAHSWLHGQRAFPYIEVPGFRMVRAALVIALIHAGFAFAATWWPNRQSGRIAPSSAMALGDID